MEWGDQPRNPGSLCSVLNDQNTGEHGTLGAESHSAENLIRRLTSSFDAFPSLPGKVAICVEILPLEWSVLGRKPKCKVLEKQASSLGLE